MEFLGIGPLELVLIILIALIVLGPRDMIKTGNSLGRFLRKTILSPSFRDVQKKMRTLPYDLMREAGLDEDVQELRELQTDIKEQLTVPTISLNDPETPTSSESPETILPTPPQPPEAVLQSDSTAVIQSAEAAANPETRLEPGPEEQAKISPTNPTETES